MHNLIRNRNNFSSILVLLFFIILLTYFGFIHYIQESAVKDNNEGLLVSPISSKTIQETKFIRFENRNGIFTLSNQGGQWFMQEPRSIPASNGTVDSVLKTLENLSLHTIHAYEPINIESFSLHKPIVTIDLYSKRDERINIKIGLINPIDNTSYITVSGKNYIYQVKQLQSNLERLTLSEFIDSNIFSIDDKLISKLSLYHGNKMEPRQVLTKKNSLWVSQRYNSISQEKVSKKVISILKTKAYIIIDKKDEEIVNFINNYLTHPMFKIKIQTKSGKMIDYKISFLTKAFKELKIEKKKYFIVTASDRPYPYLVAKEYLNNFNIRYNDIRP